MASRRVHNLLGQLRQLRPMSTASASLEYASSCCLPTSWVELPLLGVQQHSHDSSIFRFGLPEGRSSLDLPVCACLLLRAPGATPEDEDIVRPYTPIREEPGSFELLVKRYEQGKASQFLHELAPGASVGFKHIAKNIKIQHPFSYRHITMIAGGTGITPMYQALSQMFGGGAAGGSEASQARTEVSLLYGSATEADILLRDELDELARHAEGRLHVHHVIGRSPEDRPEGWAGECGWVDSEKVARLGFGPAADGSSAAFVCGLPALYDAMCGPRDEGGLRAGTALERLGYAAADVVKF